MIISSDPQRSRTDAELISALQRTYLLPTKDAPDPVADAKFGLDAVVGDEGDLVTPISISVWFIRHQGSNYSAGAKQLLALCRALVKGSRIIVLVCLTSFFVRPAI